MDLWIPSTHGFEHGVSRLSPVTTSLLSDVNSLFPSDVSMTIHEVTENKLMLNKNF